MGIYDREYIRVGPRASSGLGGLRFISFNTWLILLNVGVYLLGVMLAQRPLPVYFETRLRVAVPVADLVEERTFRNAAGSPVTSMAGARAGRDEVYKQVASRSTGEVVGVNVYMIQEPLTALGHFSTARAFFGLELWRFVTFQFLHGGFLHLFFNMFGLWIFGGMVEQYLGFKRYAAFYLVCGIFGAVAYLVLNFLGAGLHLRMPGVLINQLTTPLVGASAGVFAVIMAAAFIAPNAIVQLLFPPIPLPLWVMAYGYVGLAVINLFSSGNNAGGDAAHLGGAAAGYFFIRNTHLLRDFFDVFGGKGPARGVAHELNPGEVDRILDKVRGSGLGSLTDRERDRLRRHSEGLRRRGV